MHLKKLSQTFCTVACNISLLLNSFLPYFAAVPAYAQEADPTPIVESTPAPTPEVTVTETPVEPTAVPTEEPIVSPEPTASAETVTPIVSPEPTVSAEIVTPTPIVTGVDVVNTPTENNNQSGDNNSSFSSPEPTAPAATSIPTPTATVTPAPSFMPVTGEIETTLIPNNVSRTDLLNPILGTDKADYAPTEIAIITGHGFMPNTGYKLRITSDGLDNTYDITSDSTGDFTYSYQLDDTYRPNYLVESFNLDGVLIASVAFTDSVSNPNSPSSYVTNDGWDNPERVYTSDNSRIKANDSDDNIRYKNFNISIPVGSTIDGIEVEVEGYRTSSTSPRQTEVFLSWDDGSHYTSAKITNLPGTDSSSENIIKLGGSTDKWGRSSWSVNDFSNTNFRIKLDATYASGELYIDNIKVKVYYTEVEKKIDWCHCTPSGVCNTLNLPPSALQSAGHMDANGNPLHAGDYLGVCIVKNSTITAHNFDDTDGDGILDSGEVSEAFPWNMHLYSGSNCSGTPIANGGTSLPSGNYIFDNLTPGSYSVKEDLMNAAYMFTTASCQNVTLTANDNKTLNFGNFSYGEISGMKFNDTDGDGQKDDAEPGLANWTIQLQRNGQSVGTTLTDVNGNYKFKNLVYGTYRVREVNQTGWTQTTTNPNDITVISGSANSNINFGNKLDTGSIKVIKQSHPEDSQNFIFTLSGVGSTELDDDSGHDASARPNNHTFTKLVPGTYTLSENQVSGWYLDDISCTGVSSSAIKKDIKNRQVEITIAANQNPVCTFDNYKYGSITVCKIIIDGDRHVVNGSETPGSSFTINWDNGLNPTVINAGYTPNTRLLKTTHHDRKDAFCTTIDNLKITNYHYSQESINNTSIWQTPKYNDQYQSDIDDIGDFYLYNSNSDSNGEIDLRNDAGINRTLVLLNQYKLGKINVTKYNDLNGNGVRDCINNDSNTEQKRVSDCQMEPLLPGWTMNLSGNGSKVTGDNGSTTFDSLSPNTYTLSENIKEGWTQTAITCSSDSEPTPVCGNAVVEGDEQCDDGNRVNTDTCDNSCHNVIQRELNCSDDIDNDHDGYTDYDDNDCQISFQLVKPVKATNEIDSDSYNHKHVTVNAGDNINCYIGNRLIVPTATISKTNDAAGDLAPGSAVGYKIKVKILGNAVSNFKVTDLLSNGFVYRPGTYKVISSRLGDITGDITPPVYHSPGVWDLGNLNAGDELELTYLADISSSQQPGLYYDLAWAKGQATYGDSGDVIAISESMTDENFVGTEVPVVRSTQNSISAGVEKQETRTGEVLGASTELPSTGSSTSWLIICTLMTLLGFTLIKKSKKMLSVLLFAAFFLFPNNAMAANLSVRLEKPKTPINTSNVELNFVAMDIDQNFITVKCFKKYSTDAGFTQFGADISSPNAGYNASHCSLSSVLSTEGNYEFKVSANGVDSNVVSVDYKTSGPGTPGDYRKEHPNNCDYKIHFKTADDGGKTVKVEVYRADITNFILDAGSVVSSVSVGSNEERDVTNSVPDCNKNYYYVIRAFDNAGNGSSPVGDSVVTSTITTTNNGTTVKTGTGAIPVVNVTLAPGEENTNTTGTPGETNGEGAVLGTQEAAKNFLQKYWLYLILLLVIVVRIIGYVLSKKKNSRSR